MDAINAKIKDLNRLIVGS